MFGNLASSWKLTKLISCQIFLHLYTIPGCSAIYMYGTVQVRTCTTLHFYPERTLRYIQQAGKCDAYWKNPQQLHNKCAYKHYCLCIRALCIGYLPLTADVFAEGVCPHRVINMMAANVAINFEYNATIDHLHNCQRLHHISYIQACQSAECKTCQMLNLGILPNILPAIFLCYTVCLDDQHKAECAKYKYACKWKSYHFSLFPIESILTHC